MPIEYVTGDATVPVNRPAIIAHVCNDQGAWGAGFVLAISRRWSAPERAYRAYAKRKLGDVQIIAVDDDVMVANMIAQTLGGRRPLNDDALRKCLVALADYDRSHSIHMPRIGCGLAGGTWDEVGPIVESTMGHREVYVYDLPVRAAHAPCR